MLVNVVYGWSLKLEADLNCFFKQGPLATQRAKLPHIIGTDEFVRDSRCGLAGKRGVMPFFICLYGHLEATSLARKSFQTHISIQIISIFSVYTKWSWLFSFFAFLSALGIATIIMMQFSCKLLEQWLLRYLRDSWLINAIALNNHGHFGYHTIRHW